MAIVHTTWTTTANTNWIQQTGSWIGTDPSYQLHVELQAWITAMNDPLVSIIKTPNDSSARGSNYTRWLIQTNAGVQGENPYGFMFASRPSNTEGSNVYEWNFYNWVDSTSNNNYGSYSQQFSSALYAHALTQAGTHDVFYEATGSRPWFIYTRFIENAVFYDFIFKADRSAATSGSYYPAEQSQFVYVKNYFSANHNSFYYCTSARDNNSPKKGAVSGRLMYWEYPSELLAAYPWDLNLFGHSHYIGFGPTDFLLQSYGQTEYGDTTVIGGRDYMSVKSYWIPMN
jgi:hypothetical protein